MKKWLMLSLFTIAPFASADWGGMGYGYGHMGAGIGGMGMFLGMGLFWAILIFGAFWLFRGGERSKSFFQPSVGEEPVAIVKQRFAKGEISEDEMNSMIDQLK
jgi:uncharacterized membrane protein